jgi:hypothetical protein
MRLNGSRCRDYRGNNDVEIRLACACLVAGDDRLTPELTTGPMPLHDGERDLREHEPLSRRRTTRVRRARGPSYDCSQYE